MHIEKLAIGLRCRLSGCILATCRCISGRDGQGDAGSNAGNPLWSLSRHLSSLHRFQIADTVYCTREGGDATRARHARAWRPFTSFRFMILVILRVLCIKTTRAQNHSSSAARSGERRAGRACPCVRERKNDLAWRWTDVNRIPEFTLSARLCGTSFQGRHGQINKIEQPVLAFARRATGTAK
jgi:hypothetical protein